MTSEYSITVKKGGTGKPLRLRSICVKDYSVVRVKSIVVSSMMDYPSILVTIDNNGCTHPNLMILKSTVLMKDAPIRYVEPITLYPNSHICVNLSTSKTGDIITLRLNCEIDY